MRKSSLYQSLALHATVIFLMVVDLPFLRHKNMTLEQVPIIIDLNEVKISELTNLPTKAEFADKDSPATKVREEKAQTQNDTPPQQVKPAKPEPEQAQEEAPENETPVEPKQDFIVPPQPSKPKLPEQKPQPKRPTPPPQPKKPAAPKNKPEPKKTAPKKQQPALANPLKDLLASVDSLEKKIGEENANATIKTGTAVNNMGIEGGVGGSYFSDLSISEADAIAGRLRACWNLDSGAKGIEDMIIEIRAYLNKDGSVNRVDILDQARYRSDSSFRAIADSARRAVFVCQPYNILSQKYPQKYDMWKTMLLRFNPMNQTVN